MKIALLGSTGSIGRQTLEVCASLGIGVEALTANENDVLLAQQCRRFGVKRCWIGENKYSSLKTLLADTDVRVSTGADALNELARDAECDTVVNALLGISGLLPTLSAIDGKRRIALANKETLVAGGDIVMKKIAETGTELIPVDSEHSAIFQCLYGKSDVSSLILTASGGAFFGKTASELENVKAADALKHPNWSMGQKITVDCATMMNKGFEIIEAVHLFGIPQERVEVVIHRESVIHSMVRFKDGAVIAQLGVPDMRLPIQLSLTWPERTECENTFLDLASVGKLTFFKPDTDTFPLLSLAREAIKRGGNLPAAMNGADEAAVACFLAGKIKFGDISKAVLRACDECAFIQSPTINDILSTDKAAREAVKGLF